MSGVVAKGNSVVARAVACAEAKKAAAAKSEAALRAAVWPPPPVAEPAPYHYRDAYGWDNPKGGFCPRRAEFDLYGRPPPYDRAHLYDRPYQYDHPMPSTWSELRRGVTASYSDGVHRPSTAAKADADSGETQKPYPCEEDDLSGYL